MAIKHFIEFMEPIKELSFRIGFLLLVYVIITNICILVWQCQIWRKTKRINAAWDNVVLELEDQARNCFVINLCTAGCLLPALFYSYLIARTVDKNGGIKFDKKSLRKSPAWLLAKILLLIPVILVIAVLVKIFLIQ